MDKTEKYFAILMVIILTVADGMFLYLMISTKDIVLLMPVSLFLICIVILIILLYKKKPVYHIYDDYIVIEKKGKPEQKIIKSDVASLKFIYDLYRDRSGQLLDPSKSLRRTDFSRNELVRVEFKIHKKRYLIEVDENIYSDIILFFEGIERKETTNWVYHLVEMPRLGRRTWFRWW